MELKRSSNTQNYCTPMIIQQDIKINLSKYLFHSSQKGTFWEGKSFNIRTFYFFWFGDSLIYIATNGIRQSERRRYMDCEFGCI